MFASVGLSPSASSVHSPSLGLMPKAMTVASAVETRIPPVPLRLDPATKRVAGFMNVIAGNRTRAMIVEDFFGMGLLRTLVDSSRGFMGGSNQFSPVAGLDRILREGFSILTDNVMSGIVATRIGKMHAFPHFANQYPSRAVLTHAHHHMKQLVERTRKMEAKPEEAVLQLSHRMADDLFQNLVPPEILTSGHTERIQTSRDALKTMLYQALGKDPQAEGHFKTQAAALMRQLQKSDWHLNIPQPDGRTARMALPTYLEELHGFVQGLRQAMPALRQQHPNITYFGDMALKYAEQTTRVKDRQLWGIAAGMTASFLSPALINSFMNHAFHVKGYPAENALKVQKPVSFITGDRRPDTEAHQVAEPETLPANTAVPARLAPPPEQVVAPPTPPEKLAHYLGGTTNGVSGQFMADASRGSTPLFGVQAQRFGEAVASSSSAPAATSTAVSTATSAPEALPSAELERKYSDSWYTRLLQQGQWKQAAKLAPLLLLPLVPASGVFNTQELKVYLPEMLRKMLPQEARQHVGKYTKEYLKSTYDFCKNFPHTTQQQMAGGFALLIMSRLLNSRTPNEFRERAVDGYGGWGFWILGTPLLQKYVFGPLADKTFGSQLMHQGRLRAVDEIKHLMPAGSLQQKTLKANIWVGFSAMMTNVLLLGILEPYIAALWTKARLAKDAQNPVQ
jgi:hypothetical protein